MNSTNPPPAKWQIHYRSYPDGDWYWETTCYSEDGARNLYKDWLKNATGGKHLEIRIVEVREVWRVIEKGTNEATVEIAQVAEDGAS